MTTFTGPLDVKALDSQVTAARINVSGSATFQEGATFGTKIQSGAAGQRGTAILVQRATLAATNSAGSPAQFVLPSGSDIIGYYVDVETPFAAGALVTAARVNLRVGASANVISEVAVSASGRYDLLSGTTPGGADTSLLRNVTATVMAFVSTKALASALTAGQAMTTIVYVQN